MNGVLNFSVLDGWWYEGYRLDEKAGWALTDKRTFTDQSQQDKLDAATIYSMLENEIIPSTLPRTPRAILPNGSSISNVQSATSLHNTQCSA